MYASIMRRSWIAVLALTLMAGVAHPAGWFEDFERYTDQANYETVSGWTAVDGKSKGTLSTENTIWKQSLLCRQYPVESRISANLRNVVSGEDDPDNWLPGPGRFDIWVYDDGADIKAFEIVIHDDGSNSIGLGLRDDQVGVATNYTVSKNGVVTESAVERSVGWQLFQFVIDGDNGTEVRINQQEWLGNTFEDVKAGALVVIRADYGEPTDENKFWIDCVHWYDSKMNPEALVFPNSVQIALVEDFINLSAWSAPANMALHHILDDGVGGTKDCMDANAIAAGPRMAQGTFENLAPARGAYHLEFNYMNGPTFAGLGRTWPNFTVTLSGSLIPGSVNLGSEASVGKGQYNVFWDPGATESALLRNGDDIAITLSGDPSDGVEPSNGARWIRVDRFYLYFDEFVAPPLGAGRIWSLYE